MKGTDHFKRTIQMYLEQRAEEDALFAKNYRNPAKNIDECVTYILNYVKKSGCNGFTDGEIFGQAVHYYEENEIEVGKPMTVRFASILPLHSSITWVAKAVYAVSILQSPASFIRRKKSVSASKK